MPGSPDHRPIKILRVIARLNIGGPAYHVSVLDSGLPPDRFEQLLAAGALGRGEGSLEHLFANVASIPGLGPSIRPMQDVRAFFALVRLIRRFRPDIVETHTAKAGTLGRLAAVCAKRPRPLVVHMYHGHVLRGYFGPAVSALYRQIERSLSHVSDRLICVSESTERELLELRIARPEWFTVIRLGLDLERFSAPAEAEVDRVRAELGARDGDVLATFVGRLVPIKRVDLLLAALARARRSCPTLRLAVVGDGELRGRLEREAAALGLRDAVSFVGFRHDMELVVAATDIAVLASDSEGTPVALIEAAAGGRPAVATAVGGVPEVMTMESGRLIRPGDADGFATGLVELARDASLRERLGQNARHRVIAGWSLDRLLGDVEALYTELTQDRLRLRERARVLRVIARLNIGGPAHHVSLLTTRLPKDRYDSLQVAGLVGTGEQEAPVATVKGMPLRRVNTLAPEISPWRDLRALLDLVRVMRSFRPHIVHTHTAKAGFLGRLAALTLRPRPAIVHTFHGHVLEGYFGPRRTMVYRGLERFLGRVTDVLIGVSTATVDDLVRFRTATREQFRVVPLGLDLDRFLAVERNGRGSFRSEVGAGPDDVLLVSIGRLVPIKRLDLLLRAVTAARGRGASLHLAVVGGGECEPELRRLADELAIGEITTFCGYRHDLAAILSAADVAVLSSANEGTPVALIEAGAAGLPLVATDVGGVADVVASGTGRLVPSGDVAAFADALCELAADPELREACGQRARAHMRRNFDAQRLVDDIDALYQEILSDRASRPPHGRSGRRRRAGAPPHP